MKNNRSFRFEGFASVFVLVGMLLLVVAMPIAVKLVQQNQESRSKASGGISQTKKCASVGGTCQKRTSACAGTYVANLCSKSNKGVGCCTNIRDTDACLNVGGRCKEKTATDSGVLRTTDKVDLCSKNNGSDVGCWVVDGSDGPCTAMGGKCVAGPVKTSGGSCTAGSSAGFFDLKYSCKETDSVCCIPADYDLNGECVVYTGEPLTAVPDGLCKSGIATWDGGDRAGTDGAINWKCKGFNDALTVDCSAKFKVIVDTKECLSIGGRCNDKNKEATGSGNYRADRPDLCSKSNPSNVGCWVVNGSDSPCTAMTGKCIGNAGVTTSGGSCALANQTTGIYNLNYSCKAGTSACCLPSTVSFGGQCKDYKNQILTNLPNSLCISGTESWEDGDKLANDGTLNWKCIGSNSMTVDCSAKFKVNGQCNVDYSGDTKTVSIKPTQEQACSAGTLAWLNSGKVKNGYYLWKCRGINGGSEVGCKVKYVAGSGEVSVTSVSLDKNSLNLSVNGRDSLVATIAPPNATDQSMVWTSDKTSVATVSDSGVVTGVTSGTANIIVKTNNGNKTATAVVTVTSNATVVPVTGISLSPTSLTLKINDRQIFTATVSPVSATDKTIVWSSSDDSIITVSNNGLVTAIAEGNADVVATAGNGVSSKVSIKVVSDTTEVTPESTKVSFKFAFRGVTPDMSSCFPNLGNLKIEVMNTTSRKYETGISAGFEALDGQKNDAGDQIFQVTDLSLDSGKFSGSNNLNYVKVKGPFHLQARMCRDSQSGRLSDTTDCTISLASGTVYDFSDYPLAPGDINQDGVVNTIDYGKLKSFFNEEVDCGTNGDLNMDGVVNGVDAGLIKDSLSSKDDE